MGLIYRVAVGFTGTQRGLTEAQQCGLRSVFCSLGPFHLHHGDCIGGDATAHKLARLYDSFITTHPSTIESKRAYCQGDAIRDPLPPLIRNRIIIGLISRLLACPASRSERQRSGTWTTIRAARAVGLPIAYIFPDGSITEQPGRIKHGLFSGDTPLTR